MSPQLLRAFIQDAFVWAAGLWTTLFVCELIKPGFASNYISLPVFAAIVFVLAIVVLASQPESETAAQPLLQVKKPWLFAAGLGLACIAAMLAGGLPLWLTLILTFVTLMSFWAISTNEQL